MPMRRQGRGRRRHHPRSRGGAGEEASLRRHLNSGRNRTRDLSKATPRASAPMSTLPISSSTAGSCRAYPKPPGVVNQNIAARGARLDGSLAHAGLIKVSPVESLSEPLFNPTGGYGSYVVPAAFMLIIQQTLLMGSATLGGVAFEQGGVEGRRRREGFRAMIGQALAHLCLALPALALYLIILPRAYGFSSSNRILDLLMLASPSSCR